MFIVFFISTLAETNRAPFDLPEGESELVAGYFVEYSSMSFALFFLGEYANMILMSAMTALLFLGGWLPPFDIAPIYVGAWSNLVHSENCGLVVRLLMGACNNTALSL